MMKVFITRKLPDIVEKKLSKEGIEHFTFPYKRQITKNELIKYGKTADAIISLLSDKFDAEVISNLTKCKIIANYAVGFNNIDLVAAKEKGIIITNTPEVLTDATADLTMTLILACARRIHEGERLVREKKFFGWAPDLLLGYDLKEKYLGIIGTGRIGQAVAKRAAAFGMKILYYNKSRKIDFEKNLNARRLSLKMLLKKSDVISLHLPLNDKTRNLLDKEKLSLLKNSAILINTARGEIVDEKYLIEALSNHKIFAAGFDVYQNEPTVNEKLLKLQNVVLLPHIGSATIETRNKMAELAVDNVIRVLKNKIAITPVNY